MLFSESIDPKGVEWLHFGATTADIFRTVTVIQLHKTVDVLIAAMKRAEGQMAALAIEHRETPMIGRTLGRHALPITFGYKVAVWLSENRRSIERLELWRNRYASGVLSGAVGTHAAMGELGPKVQELLMDRLNLGSPDPIDNKGSVDIFAEFGAAVALAARSFDRVAQEIFLLQGDDIRELSVLSAGVGSSTMPHKSNPTLCVECMSRAREVSAVLPVLLDWMVTIHERDSTLHFASLEQMCIDMGQVVSCVVGIFDLMAVYPDAMLKNIGRTRGAILTESITVQLASRIGRRTAHGLMKDLLVRMNLEDVTLAEALASDPRSADIIVPDASKAFGLAPELVDNCLAKLGITA